MQLLRNTAESYPENGLVFYQPGQVEGTGTWLSYSSFLKRVEKNAILIRSLRLRPCSVVLLHFIEHLDNLDWFWAVTCAGYTPALSTPFSNNIEQRKKHIVYLDDLLDHPVCLTRKALLPQFLSQTQLQVQAVEDLSTVSVDPSFQESGMLPGYHKQGADLAALMLTSGSTGMAKAVCLTHQLILSSVAGKRSMHGTNRSTPFFNWIGADHVANLTEMHIHAIWAGATQIHAQAADIVPYPLVFLDIINKYRVAHAFAPDFFLASLQRTLESSSTASNGDLLDLSCLRTIVTGGEANVVSTCIALSKLLEGLQCQSKVLSPAFGMTETCGGSIYSKDCPRRDIERGHDFATVGSCITGLEMRIVDDDGKNIGSEVAGNLEVRGSVVFSRYYNSDKATLESFNEGWFIRGDQGMVDSAGQLNLTGRAKETLITNGVNYSPQEIETALQDCRGAKPSFTVAISYRVRGSDTESLCIVYCPTYSMDDIEARVDTNDEISKICMLLIGVRPLVIPLEDEVLQKTTLGKLSRTKIRKAFDGGEYRTYEDLNEEQMTRYRAAHFEGPANKTEEMIHNVFLEVFCASENKLGVNADLYAFGVNSIDIVRVKQKRQRHTKTEIPVITVMTHPTIRSLALALNELSKPRVYNPMIVLQSQGSRTPLWLIHPGVGEVLVFLALASQIKERPVYAMRARGFEEGESYFRNIQEVVTTYTRKIKDVQPLGPYAIAGYSYGSMIAFEIAKLLNSQDDEVKFLGAFNLPPHIKWRMRQLDWTNCILHLSYFLDFFSEEYAHAMHRTWQLRPRQEVLHHILCIAPKDRMVELGLDGPKLANWADLAYSLQSSAVDYEPSGMVECMDVFCAIPLASVAKNMDDWMMNHLEKWRHFTKTEPRFHQVDGAHDTMISPRHVESFQKILIVALENRGV